jgi:hypothetical protein
MVKTDRDMGCNELNAKGLETYVFEYLLIFQNALRSASKSNIKEGLRYALGACEEIQM